jgi:predicted DNA-binding transcriptional regulator YafY
MKQAFLTEHSDKPVEFVIRFDAHQARYIRERRWHETQQIEERDDGGLILRFSSGSLSEVMRWVMQYGSHAEVIAPEELRQAVAREVETMRRCYGQPSTEGSRKS